MVKKILKPALETTLESEYVICPICEQVLTEKLSKHLREEHDLKDTDLVDMAIETLYSLDIPEVPEIVREIVLEREIIRDTAIVLRMGGAHLRKRPKPWHEKAAWQ